MWAVTQDVNNCVHYVSVEAATLTQGLKCGTWVLTWEWALARDIMVCDMNGKWYTSAYMYMYMYI